MNFTKIVEEALKDDIVKQSAVLGSISTNSGLYAAAKTGTSAGTLGAKFGPTSVGGTSFTSFSTNSTNTGATVDYSSSGEDITTTKNLKKKKDKNPSLKACFKNNVNFSKKPSNKFKTSKNAQDAEGQNAFQ
jgi:hypothetical protein